MEQRKLFFFVFVIILLIFVLQYLTISHNNIIIKQQQQKIFEINATWKLFQEQQKPLHLRSNPVGTPIETEKIQGFSSRDLKPLPVATSKQAVLFTMDSIGTYESDSKKGGASGELLIRHCLEHAFSELGIYLEIIHSDEQFASINMDKFDIIIVDPWTWAGRGWIPKPMLIGNEKKIFVLDFFGSPTLLNAKSNFKIPPQRLLTAYGSPWNTFLGFYLNETILQSYHSQKLSQGVIWGKDPKHYSDREKLLQSLSTHVELHSTATRKVIQNSQIIWHGHQTIESWMKLLGQSKFLIGLGDPLLGPSAIDAITMGCVYINPVYSTPVRNIHRSQHDYAANKIGLPYVCNAHLDNQKEVMGCIDYAMKQNLQPFIPPDFQYNEYLKRVRRIFFEDV